jgi:hypothetical protein
MPDRAPFPFFHRVLVFLFAGGIVAIGGHELNGRLAGSESLMQYLPSMDLFRSGVSEQVARQPRFSPSASVGSPVAEYPSSAAEYAMEAWDQVPVSGTGVRRQGESADREEAVLDDSTRARLAPQSPTKAREKGPENTNRNVAPVVPIAESDESTDSLGRSDRSDLDSLLNKVTK